MITEALFKDLYLLGNEVRREVPLAWHTTMRTGGPAGFFVSPYHMDNFVATVKYLNSRGIHWKLLGGGSNVVAPDYFRGVVVSTRQLTRFDVKDNILTSECGVSMQRLVSSMIRLGLGGLEFSTGLPGTSGGAAFMNAGAFGGEMKDVVFEVDCLTPEGEITTIRDEDCGFGYRTSSFKEKGYTILRVKYRLSSVDAGDLYARAMDILQRRVNRQPLDFPSAGSVFMRPQFDFYVGSTIDLLGFKSFRVGDAEVSNKHAGFIINRGNATQADILLLVNKLRSSVFEATGKMLATEIQFWERGDR